MFGISFFTHLVCLFACTCGVLRRGGVFPIKRCDYFRSQVVTGILKTGRQLGGGFAIKGHSCVVNQIGNFPSF